MGPRKRAQRRDSRLVRARARPHGLPLETAAILAVRAAVAQLARASACHAEGRGFESLQPLAKRRVFAGLFLFEQRPRFQANYRAPVRELLIAAEGRGFEAECRNPDRP